MRTLRCERGQATVELVALLPVLVACAAGIWQLALVGHAVWAGGAAARAAARAAAVGGAAEPTAMRSLPESLRPGLRVHEDDDGAVRVTVAIPSVLGGAVTTHTTSARFEPQR
jgi:Flp pilus assembly protein TadG